MTDNPYRVHAIHYADGEVEDLDALRREAAATEAWRRSAGNAERLIERIKSGELAWDGTRWTAPPAVGLVDHTDPKQVRRAAGVLEGIGVDSGVIQPESRHWESATSLRQRAQCLEADSRLVSEQ
ncbi:hypothetical protein SEA_TIMTAM_61 [Gordonia phage TimTam]|uniref:Uncharacterized protein n=4 Tax=Nymphadoravirus nymphadora TaxID=2560507 RepID=A0A142KAT7_9CAUD|nr:hypothetical protein SEA_NYMPHADORA_61 [Gordonia phage Nymphadora]AMS03220.1 hypothetical protein SEA_NYMPHADORA_61 [Gordonia phage Nymphadora]AOE43878.1 hypothetical protein SEA_BATSTARR_60 [Gordonia phage BatStarr]QDP43340.1 hypothetical protein SEA_EVIARTO_61 [Gordonia phage Eviarto]QDP43421.1 hypothetical protein SEA_TIMTAM_61 [Gordonia phage TimTam]